MSNISVPCRQPYEAYPARDSDDIVVLVVGRDNEMERIEASVPVLCSGSEYFRERLMDRDRDMSHLPLSFPSESPSFFKIFITFLTTGTLRHPNLRSSTHPPIALGFIVELFAFSADFSATSFRNALLDAFFIILSSSPLRLRDIPIRQVYEAIGASSSLRDLLVTIIVNTGNLKDIKMDRGSVPKDFLFECLVTANEDKIIPFARTFKSDREEWMDRKMERICEEYHVHDEEEDDEDMMENDGQDMDDVDDEDGGGDGREDGDGDGSGSGDGRRTALEISEKTKRELAFVDDMRKLAIRY